MNYIEYPAPDGLQEYVKCFWTLDGEGSSGPERVVPDGRTELIIHHGDLFRQYVSPGKSILQPRSIVAGHITKCIMIEPTGRTGIIAARFHPCGLFPLLQLPMNKLRDQIIGLEALGISMKDTEERILAASSSEERLEILSHFLADRIRNVAPDYQLIRNTVNQIIDCQGQITVDELSQSLEVSSRWMERKFSLMIGLSPKQLIRILKFHNVFQTREDHSFASLTDMAYYCGYYDQAHFIRDFKEFSGLNPRSYFSEGHQLADFFNKK